MAREVEGLRELNRKLDRLGDRVSRKLLRQAAMFAMTPTLKAARAAAPVGDEPHKTHKGRVVAPGFLSRNIRKKSWISKKTGKVRASVGPTSEAWYGTLIETGFRVGERSTSVKSASRKIGSLSSARLSSLGDSRKEVPADPWLEPAFRRTKDEVLRRFSDKLERAIDKEVAKK